MKRIFPKKQNMYITPSLFQTNYFRMNKLIFGLIVILTMIGTTNAQTGIKQTIRGKVIDKDSKLPLPGAYVVLLNATPPVGTSSDKDGNFRIEGVSMGRQGISVSFLGYKTQNIENLMIASAKETLLDIELEENVVQVKEVTVNAFSRKKDEPINKMAAVSARSFTVEETEKYAGSRGDVARMAMNYAGVSSANDSRNDIIIRGNSPSGLLWRLEDVDIPNPNHFAENGTTGGPVGMINNNLLRNSDFFTSAFPAEYGNAISGVFDLKLRNGNNEKHEYVFQSGFNGFELGAEGPFTKNHKSSYLVDLRYSTMELMSKIVDFGTAGVPKYKDFTYNLNFPLKNGKLSIFGLAGSSSIAMLNQDATDNDMYLAGGQNLYNGSNMATSGISLTKYLDDKTYYKISLTGLYQEGSTQIDTLDENKDVHRYYDNKYAEFRASLSASLNKKYNSRLSTKAGLIIDRMGYNLFTEMYKTEDLGLRLYIDDKKNLTDGVDLYRLFYQGTYKVSDNFSINPGVHFIFFDFNKKYSVEPRLAVSWQVAPKQRLSMGYGLHSKIQSLYTYFIGSHMPDNSLVETNNDLGLTKSHQFVVGYDVRISDNARLKTEAYYQYLFNVPVQQRPTDFSILNYGAGWGANTSDSLVNKGTGKNIGLELTLEKFLSKGFYYLTTVSLFDSKYKGSDGIERNTAFNGNYIVNGLVGKEFTIKAKTVFAIDLKVTYAGGQRYTPIDLEASRISGETKLVENAAYTKQYGAFFKTDIKFSFRMNGRKVSHEYQFYIENLTNHKNPLYQMYVKSKDEVRNIYQLGFFPMVLYRLNF
jgi:hypothetical protein